jgi:hypothetical protein
MIRLKLSVKHSDTEQHAMPAEVLAIFGSPSATRQSLSLERLTALRPYLAAGLPLSSAIIGFRKITAAQQSGGQCD